ncbi:ead/Ea22-like family protein [Klebsiella pneumoniae]|uniref:ead/Ea22-like family protein n=1 Tax=Klebsiella pneumoniae TaxID=573 RepID=UPI00391750A6
MTDITELARRMKAAAVRAKTATEEYASGYMSVSVCYAECEEFNRLTDGPDNIIALVEALEKAQQKADVYNMLREDYNLRGKGIGLANFVDWQAKRIAELEFIRTSADKVQREFADELGCAGDNESILQAIEDLRMQSETALEFRQEALADKAHLNLELEIAEKRIAELEPINAAAEKLVRCKGRYHSEQNYRALAALFGVTTPDLPPIEHENVHYADAAEMEIAALRQRISELERDQEHLRPVGVMSEKAFHRLENSESRFIALWPRPGIFLPRKRPEDGVIVYARTAAAVGTKVEAE